MTDKDHNLETLAGECAKLRESQRFMLSLLVAILRDRGGEIVLDALAEPNTDLNPVIFTHTDPNTGMFHIKLGK